MREECEAIGRDPNEIELTAGGGGRNIGELSSHLERLQALGVSRAVLPPLPGDRLNEMADALRGRFGMDT